MTEGQEILVHAAKYLVDQWRKTPIRQADINQKLAADKLIWLVHNFDFELIDGSMEAPCEVFEIPSGPVSETDLFDRGSRIITNSR